MPRNPRPSRPRKRTPISVEVLERRDTPAAIGFGAGIVTITGTSNRNDSALVNREGASLVVKVSSTSTSGPALAPEVVSRAFEFVAVNSVVFYGYGGNDSFISRAFKSSTAYGGDGNDWLEGGELADTYYGEGGNDTLKGSAGNDNLYGGNDNDVIDGMGGNDGLYGGAGNDSLTGGGGGDRFLLSGGAKSEAKDAGSEDAVVYFANSGKTWGAAEIQQVDVGLELLHRRTGGVKILKLKNGGALTFYRQGSNGGTLADNNSQGRINVYDGTFSRTTNFAALTVVHEVAHNWDNEHTNWAAWKGLSGWRDGAASGFTRSRDGSMWYKNGSTFAREYGKTNAYEDFATAWESYFNNLYALGNPSSTFVLSNAKRIHLSGFLDAVA